MRARRLAVGGLLGGLLAVGAALVPLTPLGHRMKLELMGQATVKDRLDEFGARARARLAGPFAMASVAYPPPHATLLAIKSQRTLHLHAAAAAAGAPQWITSWPIRGMSGALGPKLRQGDRQAPEGVYIIESLNPNSRFHVSLRLSYPNDFDRSMARSDGRTDLGGDIMIHGGGASIGCLAMGDDAAEELFTLAADMGLDRLVVIIAPVDFRSAETPPHSPADPTWLPALHDQLRRAMQSLPAVAREDASPSTTPGSSPLH